MPKNTLYFRPSVYSVASISARGEGGTTERIFFHLTDNQPTGTGNPISTEDAETDWSRVVVTTFTRED